MKSSERIAYIRIFYDLIVADNVIDAGEMRCYDELKSYIKFSRQEEIKASEMTLSEAVDILRKSDAETKKELIERCRVLSISDGFCARPEALLTMSVERILDPFWGKVSKIYSYPKLLFDIPTSCIIYIESHAAECIDASVEKNYRSLFSEFRLAGFEFIFIPEVIKHYQESAPSMMEKIVGFIAPKLSEDGRKASVEKLLQMTSSEFTKDILCNKLGMEELRNTYPALLLKIGNSYVGDQLYSNYLKVDIEGNVLEDVHRFLDEFTSMLSSDVIIISNNKEQYDQFIYSGFYKLLLDTHLMHRHVRSRIFINPYKEEIYFPDIDTALRGLHRREKALYLTFIALATRNDGIIFSSPSNSNEFKQYTAAFDRIKRVYERIYSLFGGDSDKVPDISVPEIRRPMLSLIKKQVNGLADALHNIGDYLIYKDDNNTFRIHIDCDLVFVADFDTNNMIPLKDWLNKMDLM